MHPVSPFRLHLLRALYLLIAVGLGIVVLPDIVRPDQPWELMQGFVNCMLAAFGLLCALGVRYPLQMLPVLLWELVWKTLWLLLVAVPALQSGPLSPAMAENLFAVSLVVLVALAMPWRYVAATYLKRPDTRALAAGAPPN